MKTQIFVLLSTLTFTAINPPIIKEELNYNFIPIVSQSIIIDKPILKLEPVSEINQIKKHVLHYSKENKIDPALIFLIIEIESHKKHTSKSNKGALGVMQLMPSTAKWLNVNPLDLEDNIKGGVKYLALNMRRYKDTRLALAAYNAGPGNVDKYSRTIPPFKETINYVNKICGSYYCGQS